jgi:succinate dehydrogenase / fumarate reductase, cytochrome b subunit
MQMRRDAGVTGRDLHMADVNRGDRPLSPHLSIYRKQMTSISSIFTRITGNALLLGALLVVWWLLAAATSPEYFAVADGVITSWFGVLVMTLSLWALWYHSLAGLRHLIWDTGRGLDIETAEKMGWGAFGGSAVLTILTLIVI